MIFFYSTRVDRFFQNLKWQNPISLNKNSVHSNKICFFKIIHPKSKITIKWFATAKVKIRVYTWMVQILICSDGLGMAAGKIQGSVSAGNWGSVLMASHVQTINILWMVGIPFGFVALNFVLAVHPLLEYSKLQICHQTQTTIANYTNRPQNLQCELNSKRICTYRIVSLNAPHCSNISLAFVPLTYPGVFRSRDSYRFDPVASVGQQGNRVRDADLHPFQTETDDNIVVVVVVCPTYAPPHSLCNIRDGKTHPGWEETAAGLYTASIRPETGYYILQRYYGMEKYSVGVCVVLKVNVEWFWYLTRAHRYIGHDLSDVNNLFLRVYTMQHLQKSSFIFFARKSAFKKV